MHLVKRDFGERNFEKNVFFEKMSLFSSLVDCARFLSLSLVFSNPREPSGDGDALSFA